MHTLKNFLIISYRLFAITLLASTHFADARTYKLGTLLAKELAQLEDDIKNNRANPALEPAAFAAWHEKFGELLQKQYPFFRSKKDKLFLTRRLKEAIFISIEHIKEGVRRKKISLKLDKRVIDDLNDLPQETQEFFIKRAGGSPGQILATVALLPFILLSSALRLGASQTIAKIPTIGDALAQPFIKLGDIGDKITNYLLGSGL